MDWADDIAYSVHDLEDFHRCGVVPWSNVFSEVGGEELVNGILEARNSRNRQERNDLKSAHRRLSELVEGTVGDRLNEPYEATKEQRQTIRLMTSTFVGRYVNATRLRVPKPGESCLSISRPIQSEVAILKQITIRYIITIPALVAQQQGQRRLLTELFEDLHSMGSEKYVPRRFEHLLKGDHSRARRVADCVSSLTEAEAVALHGRLRGHQSGSLLDPIAR